MTTGDIPTRFVHVVAAAVTREDGRVLIAQRPAGKPLAGGWEFPGGKLEPGEGRTAGLARELREELGITIRSPRPLMRVRHTYSHGDVLIDLWVVTRYDGEPRGLDGQALRWCSRDELESTEMLPADRPFVQALRLPERLGRGIAVPPGAVPCDGLEDALEAEAAGRGQFLLLRRELPRAELERLCAAVCLPVYARGGEAEAAWAQGATGIHQIEC